MKRRSFFAALAGLLAAPSLIEKVKTWNWSTLRLRKIQGDIEFSGRVKPNMIIWSKSVEDDYMAMEAARLRPPINYATIAEYRRWVRFLVENTTLLREPFALGIDRFRPLHYAYGGWRSNTVLLSPEFAEALTEVETKLLLAGVKKNPYLKDQPGTYFLVDRGAFRRFSLNGRS